MEKQKRTQLVLGGFLIVIGALILAWRLLGWNLEMYFSWPWIVVAVGVGLLLLGLLIGEPDMAVPACIVAGIGGILYYQNTSDDWLSWSYAWALIPVFVGIGMILSAVLGGKSGKAYTEALGPITFGLVAFVVIGSFFNAFTGVWGTIAPVLLIVVGVIFLLRNFIRR